MLNKIDMIINAIEKLIDVDSEELKPSALQSDKIHAHGRMIGRAQSLALIRALRDEIEEEQNDESFTRG